MSHELAYLNGQYIPAAQLAIPATDAGFMQGTTVAEQLRTFRGKLFRLDQHLDRLFNSLKIVGVQPRESREDFERIATELVAKHYPLLPAGHDLGLSLFVTPGPYGPFASSTAEPTVGLHTYPLAFAAWARKYETGEALVVTPIRQVPNDCWPVELKCRSRMHYYLADRAAAKIEAGARALMLDDAGFVTEASTANLLAFSNQIGIFSPPRAKILSGVTVAAVRELAAELAIPFIYRDLTVDNLLTCSELLLCSTSPCVWSVTRLNGQAIGNGQPGPLSRRLQAAWSQMVGVDIVQQALHALQ